MLKRICAMAGVAAIVSIAAGAAQAATITGSAADYPNYTVFDLSPAGTSDWVMYGGSTAADVTTGLASSSFGALSVVSGNGPYMATLSGGLKVAHLAGFGAFPSATASFDANPVVVDSGTTAALSFTHRLLAPQETLKVMVMTKAPAQLWYDASASIGSDSWSIVNQPVSVGAKTQLSVVTLEISGATDDVLTFTMKSNYSNNTSPQNWWGVGIGGASVAAAVPEPASLGLLAVGAAALCARRRRVA